MVVDPSRYILRSLLGHLSIVNEEQSVRWMFVHWPILPIEDLSHLIEALLDEGRA